MAESKELTKEQQVRALREARYKKRVTRDVTSSVTPSVTNTQVDWYQRCKQLEAQLVHLEAEVKWLKQQRAKTADEHAPMTGAERVRRHRERKRNRRRPDQDNG